MSTSAHHLRCLTQRSARHGDHDGLLAVGDHVALLHVRLAAQRAGHLVHGPGAVPHADRVEEHAQAGDGQTACRVGA